MRYLLKRMMIMLSTLNAKNGLEKKRMGRLTLLALYLVELLVLLPVRFLGA